MAPEQLEGKDIDARTDVFAFGTVVHEMLTGQKAFEGKSSAGLIAAILEREPAPVSSIQRLAPPALDRLVRTCLDKDPDNRWQSAGDLLRELKWIEESLTSPERGSAHLPREPDGCAAPQADGSLPP
jgi:serine/threonine protein kinase